MLGTAIVLWVVLALVAPWHTLGDSRDGPIAVGLATWGWALWMLVMIAMLVPSTISLTVIRIIVPVSVIASITSTSPVAIFASVVIEVLVISAVFVDAMVQGDAYGDEKRFSLRTPVPQMAPVIIAWAALVAPIIIGSLGLCAGQWVWAVPLTAVGIGSVAIVPRRLHRLARRWFVIVPAGVVLHDHLVLGETLMVMHSRVDKVTIADGPDDSADLTGGVLGVRLVMKLRDSEKVVLSDITAKLLGTTIALHVSAFAFAPRRVDAAMSALTR